MKKSNILSAFLSLVFTVSLFAFANAQTSNVQVTSNNFLNNYVYKTPPYTYLPLNTDVSTGGMKYATTTGVCSQSVTKYNKFGDFGPEVSKLQYFLNEVNGAKLNGLGYFGPATLQEVKNFQYTYGVSPTGYQYVRTTQKMNDILCGNIAKVARKVYVAPTAVSVSVNPVNTKAIAPMAANNLEVNKVQNIGKNLVKEYVPAIPKTIPSLTGSPTSVKVDMATKTGFWANLEKDFNKIKENYKAYLLVFALVLALFWFLRKAATE